MLENMLADGSLKRVMQLSFELHVDSHRKTKDYFLTLKKLEAIGFRRWFYHHRLNGYSFQCDQSYININYLKVSDFSSNSKSDLDVFQTV